MQGNLDCQGLQQQAQEQEAPQHVYEFGWPLQPGGVHELQMFWLQSAFRCSGPARGFATIRQPEAANVQCVQCV